MELLYTTNNGRIQVKIEGKTLKDCFEQLGQFCEIFEQTAVRGTKRSDRVVPRVREVNGDSYFELVCIDEDRELRGLTLSIGQNKKGDGIFPKKSTTEEVNGKEVKKWLPNEGWGRYDSKNQEMKYE
jgi:hypothetical protein